MDALAGKKEWDPPAKGPIPFKTKVLATLREQDASEHALDEHAPLQLPDHALPADGSQES